MDRWKGKIAVVTGASSGIGATIVRGLVKHGVLVVGIARRYHNVQAMAEELKDASGKLFAVKCDISREEEVVNKFTWVERNLGCLSILVNCAGISSAQKVIEGNVKAWKQLFDTNVFGLSVCIREAIKSMNTHGITDGHIVNINSISGHMLSTTLNLSIYSITKHVVTLLTEALRRELVEIDSKIKVTSISPSRVMTEIFEKTKMFHLIQQSPLLDTRDVADAVLYVLSTPPGVQISELIIRPVGDTLHKTPAVQY